MPPAVAVAERPDGVAVLTLDQPGARANVLTPALWDELGAAVAALAGRTDLRGLVIASGKHGVFVAGADLKLLLAATGPDDPAVRAFLDQGNRVLFALEALPFPTCAAIDGAALGGGLELALACDFRVCGDNPKVRLGLPETTLGLIPGWGGTQRLPRVVGARKASEMLATGAGLTADEAHAAGLADPAPSDQLLEVAARRVLATPPAVREALRLVAAGAALPLAAGIALETEAFLRLVASPGAKAGIAAFFDRRK